MLIDRARIYVKAGKGGNGAMSFRREKFVPKGGPDGGDGGRGGDVRLRVKENLTSLLPFQFNQHFSAQNGQNGMGQQKFGKYGASLDVDVPPGTMVYDDETGELLADLTEPGETYLVVRGGKGGLGNVHFKSSVRQTPRIAELGEPGEERWIRLEMRIIADVGLVGLPNAGKSTLLAAASAAKPKIADYPFTTLEPNLGVVQVGGIAGQTFVMADVPGLIEGAAGGAGLGHEFLRHVTRTKVLVHVLDTSGGLEGRDPLVDFKTINEELEDYDPELLERPMLVALNKVDLPESRANLVRLKRAMSRRKLPTFQISAATGEGVAALMNAIAAELRDVEVRRKETLKAAASERKTYTMADADEQAWEVDRESAHHFRVKGIGVERFTRMTNFNFDEGADRFQRMLKSSGINNELMRQGVQPGDIVHIADVDLVWGEAEELGVEPEKRRRTAAERKSARKR
ncbi:MAG: GTPase ObgE [Thermomicrobiales bacterium]|nr:GTPase ObgE [Thermomicrobiales bacterium]